MEDTFSVRSAPELYNEDYWFNCWLSQLRVGVVRSEKLVAEVGDSSGTQGMGNVDRLKPLPNNV
jgi:hypothetical protein